MLNTDSGSPCAAPDTPITLSPVRKRACLEAAWEIEAMAALLPTLDLAEQPVAALQLRGVAARLAQLAGVVMSGLDDDMTDESDLWRQLSIPLERR